MKTKYIFAATLACLSFMLSIQNSYSQIRLGVKGGIDIISNKLDINTLNTSNRLGYQIGPTLEFIVPTSGLGGDISVLYGRKKYKVADKQDDASISDYDYISIPVNIKQRFKILAIGVFVTGGVYGNVKVSGGDIENLKNAGDVIKEYKAKNFIFGLGAGAGVSLINHLDLGIYFRGDLTKRYGDEYMDAGVFQNKKNQSWSIAATYFF